MARPFRSGSEKAIIVSASVTPQMKQYMVENNISPTKLLAEALHNCIENKPQEKKAVSEKVLREIEIKKILEYFKKIYVESLKPSSDYLEKQKRRDLICENILLKFPELTKANLWDYAERTNFYVPAESEKEKGDGNE